ncbi:MAG: hypothetical protein QOF09_2357 [Alphaproteobacteria bacterium]|jgi:hypothetical protein|nr:hypothetical protein [Alphaproteobacteria bacterium]
MKDDPGSRKEREFDAITFLLAGVLSAVVLSAIGYGIYNSSRVVKTIPSPTTDQQLLLRTNRPPSDPGAVTTGTR